MNQEVDSSSARIMQIDRHDQEEHNVDDNGEEDDDRIAGRLKKRRRF